MLVGLPLLGKILIVLIFSAFMPLSAFTFFLYMKPKKQEDYNKAMREMGINSSRTVDDVHNFHNYFLPVAFTFLICFLASAYFAFNKGSQNQTLESIWLLGGYFGEPNPKLINQSLAVLAYTFLGAFIWSATNIIRRLIAYDLSPSVYYSAGIRIILASAIALTFSFLLGEQGGALLGIKSSLPFIAFFTGMFPERVFDYLIRTYQKFVNPNELNDEQLSLYRIEGISMAHKERLEEIGIDNAQNLATTSLTKLCMITPFPSRQLLDWIGQAKLLCYLKEDIEQLRKIGIRSVFDFYKGEAGKPDIETIATATQLDPIRLRVVYEQIKNDIGIQALYNFQTGINSPKDSPNIKKVNPPMEVSVSS